jgi:hypothetical protein
MIETLSGWQRFKAIIARWLVVEVASRISPLAVISLCIETTNLYYESIEAQEGNDE